MTANNSTGRPSRTVLAFRLRNAILDMTSRYGDAVYQAARSLIDGTDVNRYYRAAHRRYKAIMRLTNALEDLVKREETR